MTPTRRGAPPPGEGGFVLIEILVSALILAIVAGAVFTTLQSTTRSAADQRLHSVAQALAQEDQARLRTTRISALNGLKQVTPVTIDGRSFTIESTGLFINNTSGAVSCVEGETSADYVRITSTVSWTSLGKRPPVTMQSIVSPSTGSLDPSHGTLTIEATNGAGGPLAGVGLSGTGAGTFSGSTDAAGCATFADLPAGNYTLTPSAPGLVDTSGEAPKAQTVGVIASSTQVVQLRYDLPGAVPIQFKYRVGSSSIFKPVKLDSVVVYNGETSKIAKAYPSAGGLGVREATVMASPLFPFTTLDAVYAGSCEANNPNPKSEKEAPGAAGITGVLVPAGKTVEPPIVVQVPSVEVTVRNGSTPIKGARITIEDDSCNDSSGNDLKRVYTSEKEGHQSDSSSGEAEYGIPYGQFDVCASANISGGNRRKTVDDVVVQSFTSSAVVDINLSSGYSSTTCP